MSRANSIMQTEKECYITGSKTNLQLHHVFPGPRRKASDEWGCWIWLRADWHNMTTYSIHMDRSLMLRVQQETQIKFESLHGHEKFMDVFGKSYI